MTPISVVGRGVMPPQPARWLVEARQLDPGDGSGGHRRRDLVMRRTAEHEDRRRTDEPVDELGRPLDAHRPR